MYAHGVYEVAMEAQTPKVTTSPGTAPTVDNFGIIMDVTGTVAEWAPGLFPHALKSVAYVQQAVATHANALSLRLQHVKGIAGTATNIAHIVVPTTVTTLGQPVYYVVSGYVEIKPGELVRAVVTAAGSAGAYGQIALAMEPRWEEAANVTAMVLTTGKPSDA